MRWGTQGAGRQSAKWCAVTDELGLIDRKIASLGVQHLETFQSKREARRYIELRLLTRAGKISHLRRQVTYKLYCPVGWPGSRAPGLLAQQETVVTTYTSDFEYVLCADDLWGVLGEYIVEDCKGFRERMYLLKKKWLLLQESIVIYET